MLWVGWFGFNAGSALAASGDAGMTMTVTHISAATAALVWLKSMERSRPRVTVSLRSPVSLGSPRQPPGGGFFFCPHMLIRTRGGSLIHPLFDKEASVGLNAPAGASCLLAYRPQSGYPYFSSIKQTLVPFRYNVSRF
jgi:Ammonium Transporter Family